MVLYSIAVDIPLLFALTDKLLDNPNRKKESEESNKKLTSVKTFSAGGSN